MRSMHMEGLSGFGDILATLAALGGSGGFGEPKGDPIATGKDAVMKAINDKFKEDTGSPMPASHLAEIEKDIDKVGDDVALYEIDGGLMIRAKRGQGGKSEQPFGEFDIDSLARAMRFSDRHGGRSMFDEDIGSMLRDRLRAASKKDEGVNARSRPMKDFIKSFAASTREKKPETQAPIAVDIALAASLTATELARFGHMHKDSAAKTAASFAQLVQDLEIAYPAKLKNLAGYLEPYGVNVKNLAERARQFAREQRSDTAEMLARDLALANLACVNAVRDADDKAKKLAANATDI